MPDATRADPDDRDLVRAWTSANGGTTVTTDRASALVAPLAAAMHATPRAEPWFPMHAAWWIVPFALALSFEWWIRRRHGLA